MCQDRHVLLPKQPEMGGCPTGWVRRDQLQPGMTVRSPRGRLVTLTTVDDGDYSGFDEFGEPYTSPGPGGGSVVVVRR